MSRLEKITERTLSDFAHSHNLSNYYVYKNEIFDKNICILPKDSFFRCCSKNEFIKTYVSFLCLSEH